MAFLLVSPAFSNGGMIPVRFACDGPAHSPELNWSDAPRLSRSFALIVHDPDAPRGDFTHWLQYDIPVKSRRLPESDRADHPGLSGMNDFNRPGYGAPCPPPGSGPHRYIFTLYALDIPSLRLRRGARRSEVETAIRGHILGQAMLLGRYERRR